MTETLKTAQQQMQNCLDLARKERDEAEKEAELAMMRREASRQTVERLIAAAEALDGPTEALVEPTPERSSFAMQRDGYDDSPRRGGY